MDLTKKSSNLLEMLANSIYDRDTGAIKQYLCFTLTEIKIVEKWLGEVLDEAASGDNHNAASNESTTIKEVHYEHE